MQTTIQKWGNSLALRIPKALAIDAKLEQNEAVDLSISKGKIIITPIRKEEYSLHELLECVSPDNLHGEWDMGTPGGKEIW